MCSVLLAVSSHAQLILTQVEVLCEVRLDISSAWKDEGHVGRSIREEEGQQLGQQHGQQRRDQGSQEVDSGRGVWFSTEVPRGSREMGFMA